MIQLCNIHKSYSSKQGSVTALENINLVIQPGEIVGIIGRSGAGKSTLLRCVNLLERPTQGQVLVHQQDLLKMPEAALRKIRHRMGMIFQHFNLLQSRTVYDNVALPLEFMHISAEKRKNKILPLLELVGLTDKMNHYPNQLSGGQKQRVAIARALVTSPEILLCDEMTSALDPETTGTILNVLKDIPRKLKISVLLITHEMEVIKTVADRVIVLNQGRIVEEGSVLNIFKHPQSETTKSLIRSTLKLDLPESLRQQLQTTAAPGTHPVLRIAFVGHVAEEPIIAELVKKFDVRLNILQANLEFLSSETIGIMFATAHGETVSIDAALHYLKKLQIDVELLGYLNQ